MSYFLDLTCSYLAFFPGILFGPLGSVGGDPGMYMFKGPLWFYKSGPPTKTTYKTNKKDGPHLDCWALTTLTTLCARVTLTVPLLPVTYSGPLRVTPPLPMGHRFGLDELLALVLTEPVAVQVVR